LARPGGNITGVSIQQPEVVRRRVELLREVMPQLRRLAIMADAGYAEPVLEAERVRATANALGLEATRLEVRRSEDIAPDFEAIRGKTDALYVVSDALIAANRTRIAALALSAQIANNSELWRLCPGWRSHVLRAELRRPVPAGCRYRRQNLARDKARPGWHDCCSFRFKPRFL
jgi:hypothetical protein